MDTKFQIGERISDGFQEGIVTEIDIRPHGYPDYFILWDNGIKSYEEENFLDKL